MKRFFSMPIVDGDPGIALSFEDGLPHVVDTSDLQELRGMAPVLAHTTKASDVLELATVARLLDLSHVRIARTDGLVDVYDGSTHACLEEAGVFVFALHAKPNDPSRNEKLVEQFVRLAAYLTGGSQSTLALGIALKALGSYCKLPSTLRVQGAVYGQEKSTSWGLGFAVTDDEANKFIDLVAQYCPSQHSLSFVLAVTRQWLGNLQPPPKSISELIDRFLLEKPLGPTCPLPDYQPIVSWPARLREDDF